MPLSDVGVRFGVVASEKTLEIYPDFPTSRRTEWQQRGTLWDCQASTQLAFPFGIFTGRNLMNFNHQYPWVCAMFLHSMWYVAVRSVRKCTDHKDGKNQVVRLQYAWLSVTTPVAIRRCASFFRQTVLIRQNFLDLHVRKEHVVFVFHLMLGFPDSRNSHIKRSFHHSTICSYSKHLGVPPNILELIGINANEMILKIILRRP